MCVNWTYRCVCVCIKSLSLTRHPYKQIYFYVCKLNIYVCVCGSDGKQSACNAGDLDSIPGLGRSPGEGNGNHSSILAWKILWIEEPAGYSSWGCRVRHD